ncbi:MAG: DNA-3-methyladenine glycosylase I [Spirochaetaceae bacterium]|nr:DNA-3-methyladenine glycosylase I [Spirochaetaceae bacterium]
MEQKEVIRCPWCLGGEIYTRYHDEEWGVPLRDSGRLFEALVLDGAQAGLSWITILKRREGYRAAFDGFDPEKIVRYGEGDVARLLNDSRIVRNRLKVKSAIQNARAVLAMRDEGLTLADFFWNFVDGEPIMNRFKTMAEIPASTPLSTQISQELKHRGFSFVGPTIIYAMMQACGLVNDHLTSCFRHNALREKPAAVKRG